MIKHFRQCAPPSIHDVYRGLPIGPGGVEPFIFRDRGQHPRPPARFPWKRLLLARTKALRGMLEYGQWRQWLSMAAQRLTRAILTGFNPASGSLSEKVCRDDARSPLPNGPL